VSAVEFQTLTPYDICWADFLRTPPNIDLFCLGKLILGAVIF